ncbi:MAG: PDDEXK nuclease domain-containing protein [Bacteroidales bacterium]|nr:PDDEXK nuclease domain-containing protein [Bacteroidales bacterium]
MITQCQINQPDINAYFEVVANIKQQIRTAQYKAVLGANREMLLLYWNIGKTINEKTVWGNKFIENLAKEIRLEFPTTTGYSVRNLKYMAKFFRLFPDFEIVQVLLAQITWYHHIALMDKVKDMSSYLWHTEKTIENGWTRNVLVHQIETNLYQRQVNTEKVSNFVTRLPAPHGELVEQTMKDSYVFDFISFNENIHERDIEMAMVKNVTKLLLELGEGFAFLGNQYHLEVGGEDFYVDLLFYNLKLRSYVVIELKTNNFKPEYVGKLNFYLSVVDDMLKTEADNPSIGLLLCKENNKVIAKYALKSVEKPIGVSEYQLTKQLPKNIESVLPSVEDIENKLII